MAYLPLANILHHKLRSFLAAMGIGIGVCMLITLTGLARGTLFEIAERWESVNADLIVMPPGWGHQAATRSGSGLSDRYAKILTDLDPGAVEHVVPVFLWPMQLAGQDQMACGINPDDWAILSDGRELVEGRLFDPDNAAAAWLEQTLRTPTTDGTMLELTDEDLGDPAHNCLEIVIDQRLADAGGYEVGQIVRSVNHDWRIVGIAPAGVMSRVFLPHRTAQFLFASGDISRSTFMFVKLTDGSGGDIGRVARYMGEKTGMDVIPLADYRGKLMTTFGRMFDYIHMVNLVALAIAFLFITIILYTMVIQQTRAIAILKANGASDWFLIRQVMAESLLLTVIGVAIGIALSLLAAWLIRTCKPLLTPQTEWRWVATAVGVAFVGAMLSSIYPAYRATRVDVAASLSLE